MTHQLKLELQSPGICRVVTGAGLHVGNLKSIGGVWKFKAIGYDAAGQVVPGGGLLTEKHNMTFAALDQAQVNAVLAEIRVG